MKVLNVFCKVMSSVSPVLGANNTIKVVKFAGRTTASIESRTAAIKKRMHDNKVSADKLQDIL